MFLSLSLSLSLSLFLTHSLSCTYTHKEMQCFIAGKKDGGPAKALHYKTYTTHVSFFLYYRTKQFLYM